MTTDFPAPRMIPTNGIELACHELGSGRPVILLHGFPELAFSWRFQLPALAAAGYRAIAPDLRGYGASSKPTGVHEYTIQKLLGDVTGLLDSLSLEKAIFIGHDWGSLLLWQMALLAPERMEGLIQLNIPFIPRTSIDPIELMRERFGEDFYIVNFQDSDEADRVFAANPEHFFRVVMRRLPIRRALFRLLPRKYRSFSFLRSLSSSRTHGSDLMPDKDLAVFIDAYRRGGFSGPINWYRNWSHNWRTTEGVEQRVRVPTLFVAADDDVLISPRQIRAMRPHIDDLESRTIRKCGHWTQQEQPEKFNRLMLAWLRRRFPPQES